MNALSGNSRSPKQPLASEANKSREYASYGIYLFCTSTRLWYVKFLYGRLATLTSGELATPKIIVSAIPVPRKSYDPLTDFQRRALMIRGTKDTSK